MLIEYLKDAVNPHKEDGLRNPHEPLLGTIIHKFITWLLGSKEEGGQMDE